ncbi:hypothetical protein ACWD7T_31170, partial [Streptomyces sp. 900116325]
MTSAAYVQQPTQDAATVRLLRCAAVFLPAPLPREGRVAFWDPDGGPLPAIGGAMTAPKGMDT